MSEDSEPTTSRQPTSAPDIGDVGYISKGRFHLLIPTGSPGGWRRFCEPNELEQLEVESPVPAEPGCLHTPTIQKIGLLRGVYHRFTPLHVLPIEPPPAVPESLPPTPTLEPGTCFSFNLTGDRGAALVTTGERRRKDYPDRLKPPFEKCIRRDYKSWVQLAREKPDGKNARPVLVTGFDVTKDFAMVAYSNRPPPHDPSPCCTRMSESPHFQEGWEWHGEYQPNTNHGPQDARDAPTEFNQRVFIRYYTMRFRTFPKEIRAGAGPHDLGSGDNREGASPKLTVQSGAELTTSGNKGLGRQLGPITEGTGSEPGTVVPSTPLVWFLPYVFVSTLKISSRLRNMTAGIPLRITYFR